MSTAQRRHETEQLDLAIAAAEETLGIRCKGGRIVSDDHLRSR